MKMRQTGVIRNTGLFTIATLRTCASVVCKEPSHWAKALLGKEKPRLLGKNAQQHHFFFPSRGIPLGTNIIILGKNYIVIFQRLLVKSVACKIIFLLSTTSAALEEPGGGHGPEDFDSPACFVFRALVSARHRD